MKHPKIITALAVAFSILCMPAYVRNPTKPSGSETTGGFTLLNVAGIKWTGDLDGMIKRRIIRVLAPYSKTLYFVYRGVQHGQVYDAFKIFEDDLNKKLNARHIKIHVII